METVTRIAEIDLSNRSGYENKRAFVFRAGEVRRYIIYSTLLFNPPMTTVEAFISQHAPQCGPLKFVWAEIPLQEDAAFAFIELNA